jgi:uncharacterized repeat protein (TIGR03803 family)
MKRIVNALSRLSRGKRVYALVLCAATAMALPAQTTFTLLHSFDGTDGEHPQAALVQATNGDLYGTTYSGGIKPPHSSTSFGTAFQMSPSGTLKTIHKFCSQTAPNECLDGASPTASLLQAPNGDMYGTTTGGGDNLNCNDVSVSTGCGIVFKMTLSGTVTPIYDFCPNGSGQGDNCADGFSPKTALIQAGKLDFYGTTSLGAPQFCGAGYQCWGTVFQVMGNGTLTTLYNFCKGEDSPCPDGANPEAGLIQASDGDFYGTTFSGGAITSACDGLGCGTVFKITSSGTLTPLHSFCAQSGCPDGSMPQTALIQATNGDIYGVTPFGGAHGGGSIFQIANGGFTTLYSFCSEKKCADGSAPTGLIQGSDGNFYGTTSGRGANGKGTVFEWTASGVLMTLYSFCAQTNCTDGATPEAGLVQDTDGTFYGTTDSGGANNKGTVFSLSTGLGPFVETQTDSGAVGAAVTILGTGLTGATKVTFNGTSATFTVVSGTEITTAVPAGATTGPVQVATLGGSTLSSNVPFRVLP